eukprot:CAMPEP_0172308158 /NCGR_PEP_ID=MMETSP1058-20130122/8849_1 /TAXON_ID=83371 /ORGANISM="Detonula confervacea, Strain CCMP 353" /LENGTH=1272 /DNA_ID=CAMNT_0013020517 /DNA_START=115 /DNA_END=3933 /DNA_ORIENTATION=+
MNILPTASKENEENDPPLQHRRPSRKLNVLGTSRRHSHANSPRRKNSSILHKKEQLAAEQVAAQQLLKSGSTSTSRHIHWQDDDSGISPTSLSRNLDEALVEQGWSNNGNGVYIHDGSSHPHHENQNQVYFQDDGTLDDASSGSNFSASSFSSQQRTGLLQRRFALDSSSKEDGVMTCDNLSIPTAADQLISPNSNESCTRRIIRRPKFYSATTKRRMGLMSCAVGLALLGYFVEVRQIMNAASRSTPVHREWIMSLPQVFPSSILGKGGGHVVGGKFNNDVGGGRFDGRMMEDGQKAHRTIVSMEAERAHVHSLYKSRAEKRRLRTMPPSAYPSIPAAAVAAASVIGRTYDKNGEMVPPPPRLTLDLPAHRELEDDGTVEGRRSLQAVDDQNIHNGIGSKNNIRRNLKMAQPAQTASSPICGADAREASQLNPNHYPPTAHIGPKSRIVITGALSQVGMELVLQLYEQCGVQFIVGIDAAYPNTRHERLDMIESRYKYIERRVPGFQRLIVPFFGVHPHPNMGEEVRFEKMGQGFDLVSRLKPTHIVHLSGMEEGRGEYTDYGDTVDASPFAEGGQRSMMRRFESLLSMDQIFSSVAKLTGSQPQVVYVSSNEVNDSSGVSFKSTSESSGDTTSDESDAAHPPHPASVYGTSSLLKEVLASYYHRHHGVDSVGLRVPTVFGPFARPGSFIHDLTERTVRNAVGNSDGVPKNHHDRDHDDSNKSQREGVASGEKEQMVYVYDVASAIVAAMQFKKDYTSLEIDPSGPTLIRLGSKLVTSMKELKDRMEGYLPPADPASSSIIEAQGPTNAAVDNGHGLSIYDTERNRNLLGWTHKTMLHEGTKTMLAWQISKLYPFGLPESVPNHSALQNILEDSMSTLSYHRLPCASGCRWDGGKGGMCEKSPWDDVIDTTKELTQSCPYVLYTVDLRPELVTLDKQSAPSQRKGWEDWFCKIAFVSATSKLAENVYTNEMLATVPEDKWNGSGKSGNWIIVLLEGTQYSMPEYERSMAKLTPTNLFHDKVEKAMFVSHRRVILTTDQAMGVMQHLEMNERKDPEKRTIQDEKTKEDVDIWLPPQPHRHSVFFTNKYSFDEGFDTSSARKLANFVMQNAGIAETKDIRAQITFYEQTGHLTRTSMQRSPNYQEFFQDNFFPYDFLRSSWLVHELKSEEGRNLRCEMYEEHALWGNSAMEDLSMGFVLAKRKVKMQLGGMADPQFKGPEEWYPLLVPREQDDEDAITEGPAYLDYLEAAQKVATERKGHEYYVTFLPQRLKK